VLFQPVDEKRFAGIYTGGKLHRDSLPEGLSKTWKYCPFLGDTDIVYAFLYCGGKSLNEVCPPEILPRWEHISGQLKAHFAACREAKVNFNSHSFLDLVPHGVTAEFFEIKNCITDHVLRSYPKPPNYDFLLSLEKLLYGIRSHEINLNLGALKPLLTTVHSRAVYRRLQSARRYVDYDAYKTKTGRLTTKKGSFPILTLNKQFRCAVQPTNDYFVELDFNAAELRTLLALSNKIQPTGDIHEWNANHVYDGLSREDAKKKIFAWLYNPESVDQASNKTYNRQEVLEKYFDGTHVNTIFGRTIPSDDHHALNYIVQSTTSDLLLKRAVEIDKMAGDRKSHIAFTLHDSLIIDFAEEDKDLFKPIVDTFKNTDLGTFVVNIAVGKNFGEMKELGS
jgi:hypothetical protein